MPDLRYKGHMPGLDVLRGIAIAGVLAYHGLDGRLAWDHFSGLARWGIYLTMWGSSGVELFFVLSGFLITGILVDSAGRPEYYRRFYVHRVLRILPAYVLILGVLRFVHEISWHYVLACLLYIANMARLVGAHNAEYGAFWSLAVEEQFYLLWPWIIRRCSLATLSRAIPIYWALSMTARFLSEILAPQADFAYKLWGNADWLLAGAYVAIALRTGSLGLHNIRRWMYGLGLLGAAMIPLIVHLDVTVHLARWQSYLLGPFYRVPVVLLYVSMLLFVVLHTRGKKEAASCSMPARFFIFLGYISYGLYLVHPLVFSTVDRWASHTRLAPSTGLPNARASLGNLLVIFFASGLASIGIAYLSRRYFEERFLRMKDRFMQRRPLPETV